MNPDDSQGSVKSNRHIVKIGKAIIDLEDATGSVDATPVSSDLFMKDSVDWKYKWLMVRVNDI